jgi:preprotein translocase subunit SecD
MKTLIFSIITVIICITLTSAIQKSKVASKVYHLQSDVTNTTAKSLEESADIISARLKLFGLTSFEVHVLPAAKQIEVQINGHTEFPELEGLLCNKGEMGFYATFSREEAFDILQNSNHLDGMMNSDQVKNQGDPRIGCVSSDKTGPVIDWLRTAKVPDSCKLCWGEETGNTMKCLFALRLDRDGNPLLVKSDIESIKVSADNNEGNFKTQIKLSREGAVIFARATKANMHKSIAVVIDDEVYYWPRVQNVIEGGEVEITGKLTRDQVYYFIALGSTDDLPIKLKLAN